MRAMWFETPLGPMVAIGDAHALAGLHFGGAKHLPNLEQCEEVRDCLLLRRVQHQVQEYFAGRRASFDLPLAERGTDLQRAVWEALAHIPLGTTISYLELARRVGRPRAVRAVAQAVGRNPWTLLRPCHRVVGSDGSLTGFAGGLERKSALLALEGKVSRNNRAPADSSDRPVAADVHPMRAANRPGSGA